MKANYLYAVVFFFVSLFFSCKSEEEVPKSRTQSPPTLTELPKIPHVKNEEKVLSKKNTSLEPLKPTFIVHGVGENRIFIGSNHMGGRVIDFFEPSVAEYMKRIFFFNPRKEGFVEGKALGEIEEIPLINKKGKTPFFRELGVERFIGIDTRKEELKKLGVYDNASAIAYADRVLKSREKIVSELFYQKNDSTLSSKRGLTPKEVASLQEFKTFWDLNASMEKEAIKLPDSTLVMLGAAHIVSIYGHRVPGRYYVLVNTEVKKKIVKEFYQDQLLRRLIAQAEKGQGK